MGVFNDLLRSSGQKYGQSDHDSLRTTHENPKYRENLRLKSEC